MADFEELGDNIHCDGCGKEILGRSAWDLAPVRVKSKDGDAVYINICYYICKICRYCFSESSYIIYCPCGNGILLCDVHFEEMKNEENHCKICSRGGRHIKPCRDE